MDKDFHIEIRPVPGNEVCDFCSSDEVYMSYDCKDFVAFTDNGWNEVSKGMWAACRPCSELVDAGRWEDLLERSVEQFAGKYGFMVPEIRKRIRATHYGFRTNRRKAS